MAITTTAWILFAVSTVIQHVQANKIRDAQRRAQEEADARADAAKGFQLVTSAEPAAIPIVYGRAKVGGSRVYHATFNNYTVPSGLDATVASMNTSIFRANNDVKVSPPPDGYVRQYFVAPEGFNPQVIPNTVGHFSVPVIKTMETEGQLYDNNGGSFGRDSVSGGAADQ